MRSQHIKLDIQSRNQSHSICEVMKISNSSKYIDSPLPSPFHLPCHSAEKRKISLTLTEFITFLGGKNWDHSLRKCSTVPSLTACVCRGKLTRDHFPSKAIKGALGQPRNIRAGSEDVIHIRALPRRNRMYSGQLLKKNPRETLSECYS